MVDDRDGVVLELVVYMTRQRSCLWDCREVIGPVMESLIWHRVCGIEPYSLSMLTRPLHVCF